MIILEARVFKGEAGLEANQKGCYSRKGRSLWGWGWYWLTGGLSRKGVRFPNQDIIQNSAIP